MNEAPTSGTNPPVLRRYILLARTMEQLAGNKAHLAEIIFIAQQLKRTLILPNVEYARLQSSGRYNFSTYFNTSLISQYYDQIVEYPEFISENAKTELSTMFITVVDDMDDVCQHFLVEMPHKEQYWPLIHLNFVFNQSNSDLCIQTIPKRTKPSRRRAALEHVISKLYPLKQDIIVIQKLGFAQLPIKPSIGAEIRALIQPPLNYTSKALEFIQKVGRLLAIQWRMETTTPSPDCVRSLLSQINHYEAKFDAIYLSTDFTDQFSFFLLKNRTKSASWNAVVDPATNDEFQHQYDQIMTERTFQWYNATDERETGIVSILEKSILANAHFTLLGKSPCSRTSKWAKEIARARSKHSTAWWS